MILETLRLPLLLTGGLANVITAKTLGDPLFVKTYKKSLVDEKILCYSLVEKYWVWDIGDVKATSIDGNVVKLLTRKLKLLPDYIMEVLKVAAYTGSYVDEMTIELLLTRMVPKDIFSNIYTSPLMLLVC